MTVERDGRQAGVRVHFEPDECELFVKLALDADEAAQAEAAHNYLSLSLKLAKKIDALLAEERNGSGDERVKHPMADRMVALILGPDDFSA